MDISKQAFLVPRTPPDLQRYVDEAYTHICADPEMVTAARLKKEPYKTFAEELVPFATFCTWKYGSRLDIACSLVPGTPGWDAIVKQRTTGIEHVVEITWPMNGKLETQQGHQLNQRGITDVTVWNSEDLTMHREAIDRVIHTAHKKALRDYHFAGGSTLIFVFDEMPLFTADHPMHAKLLDGLAEQLKQIDLQVDNTLLMLMPKKTIVTIKNSETSTSNL